MINSDLTLESVANRNQDFAKRIANKYRYQRYGRSGMAFVFYRQSLGNQILAIRRTVNRISIGLLAQLSASLHLLTHTFLYKQIWQKIGRDLLTVHTAPDVVHIGPDRQPTMMFFHRTRSFKQVPSAALLITRTPQSPETAFDKRPGPQNTYQPYLFAGKSEVIRPPQLNRPVTLDRNSGLITLRSNRILATLFETAHSIADTALKLQTVYRHQSVSLFLSDTSTLFFPVRTTRKNYSSLMPEKELKRTTATTRRQSLKRSVQNKGDVDSGQVIRNFGTSSVSCHTAVSLFNSAIHTLVSDLLLPASKEGKQRLSNIFPLPALSSARSTLKNRWHSVAGYLARAASQDRYLSANGGVLPSRQPISPISIKNLFFKTFADVRLERGMPFLAKPFRMQTAPPFKGADLPLVNPAESNTAGRPSPIKTRNQLVSNGRVHRPGRGIFSAPIPPTGAERLPGTILRASRQSESHFGPRTGESFNPSNRYSSSIVYKSTAKEGMEDTRTDRVQPNRFYRTLSAIQNTRLPGIDQEINFRTTSRYLFNKIVWRHGLLSSIYHNTNKIPSLPSGKHTTTAMTAKSLSGFYQGSLPGRMTQSNVTGSRHSFSESRRTTNGSSLQNPIRGFGDQPNSDLITVRRQPLKQPALRSEPLVFLKPVNREKLTTNHKETETVREHESKSITDKTEIRESIKKLGTREIHSIAEKVFGLLERRISIEKDRRGIR